jgi:trehalose 6-phosphate synthase/phosphatase
MDRVHVGDRTIQLAALPIGIETDGWDRLLEERATVARVAELRARHQGRQLVISVDRLDYTKGIPERLRTFRRLLQGAPKWRTRVTLVQVAVPSRERVPAYAELRREVAELVGEVNGEFGTPEWQPVVYLRRAIDKPELAALYAAADVAWVGPVRDGMNLVAKEYVACQRGGDGVLVLSEFAGAAQELGEALRINPYDEVGTADTVRRALELDRASRSERMTALHARVRRDDASAWASRFIDRLQEATAPSATTLRRDRPFPQPQKLRAAFDSARERLILLDYDGTLVDIARRPQDARPGPELMDELRALASLPATTTAVISGRSRSDIAPWLGDIPGLWLAVEHGALVRAPDGDWELLRGGAELAWKARVRPILEQFASSAPGAYVEEKELSLGWHYRLADAEFGGWLAATVVATLEDLLAGTELTVLHGNKVIEVRYAWANKGEVAARLVGTGRRGRFILAIGDDRTDEEMFVRLPRTAWTVRVGPGATAARFRLAGPASVIGLLDALVAPTSGVTAPA